MISKKSYLNVLACFFIIAVPHILQQLKVIPTNDWVIHPDNGLISILTGTFLHGSWAHMTGNLAAMLVGTTVVAAFYKRMYWPVIVLGILAPSILAYIGGVPTLGISGLAYAFIWFIIFRGFMSRDYVRMGIAIGMCLIYGGTLRGAAPMGNLSNIAWDGHLAGLCVGLLCSVYSRLKRM